jgi:hypothetical protein
LEALLSVLSEPDFGEPVNAKAADLLKKSRADFNQVRMEGYEGKEAKKR